ncbi:MAG: ABC transporter permease [candidate division KSB1 bacterium]|nr:ABC transporter permease [candidate division KSB1 bacterium]MDZ7338583.1 ABC transporter permease [candidate division KSB1 bacterium]MDZ7379548.1 ABC transporter permease [candidate division KSB1 bacterium]MDZ7385008.1 ABC transporter permease [candidate division KSB1 bacterium]MDZ7391683.1 ABC transporter permease [candidate division KSB1 bacterium]
MLRTILSFFVHLHGLFETFLNGWVGLFRRPLYGRAIIEQMDVIGVRSTAIVVLTSMFTGLVLALQSGYEMAIYGAKMYVGTLLSVSLVRELGPVLAALIVTGRVGSAMAAEIGSMAVTEQIDAMRALGTDPIKKLVTTRMVAATVMLPVLTAVADAVGVLGGLVVAVSSLGISSSFYWVTVVRALTFDDLVMGLTKPVLFGVLMATVGCYMGMSTTGGTRGVGESTTKAVVLTSVLIFAVDFLFTKLYLAVAS